jgi:hypothetical protein
VVLGLVFSFVALFTVFPNIDRSVSNSPATSPTAKPTIPENTIPSNTSTPTVSPNTGTPQPSLTLPESVCTLSYTETSHVEKDGITKITLTIDVAYISGGYTLVDNSMFYLQLSTGSTSPKNSVSFMLGTSHPSETFQLNFEFPTTSSNGTVEDKTSYQLKYRGPTTVQWINQ